MRNQIAQRNREFHGHERDITPKGTGPPCQCSSILDVVCTQRKSHTLSLSIWTKDLKRLLDDYVSSRRQKDPEICWRISRTAGALLLETDSWRTCIISHGVWYRDHEAPEILLIDYEGLKAGRLWPGKNVWLPVRTPYHHAARGEPPVVQTPEILLGS